MSGSPPRVAHCIIGTAYETAWRQAHGSAPFYDSRNYARHGQWLEELRGTDGSVHVDLFLVLETRKMPRRTDFFVGERKRKGADEMAGQLSWLRLMQTAYGSNTSLWPWNRTEPSLLRPMIEALQPARVVLYEESLQCIARPCLCAHEVAGGPSVAFWEMMAKNTACLQAVRDREAHTERLYDYVSRTRTERAFIAADVVRRLALAATHDDIIHVGQSMSACHGGADWAAFMPRALAPAYFDMSDDACLCAFVLRHRSSRCNAFVESYLWTWAERHPLHPTMRKVS